MNESEKIVSHHGQNYRTERCTGNSSVEQKDWPFFYFDDDHAGTMPRKRRTRTVCSTVEHLRNCVQFSLPCRSICPSLSRLFSSSSTREKLGLFNPTTTRTHNYSHAWKTRSAYQCGKMSKLHHSIAKNKLSKQPQRLFP